MKQVTVTISTDKPVSVKITPCKDALDELLETLGDDGEPSDCETISKGEDSEATQPAKEAR